MALKLSDKTHETTTSTGTGNINLLGAVPGLRTFIAAIGNGNQTYYVIEQVDLSGVVTDWEIGIGTVIAGSPPQLQRNTIKASTNSNLIINWGAGTKDVYSTVAADAILLASALFAEIAAAGSSAQATALGNLGATTLGKALFAAVSASAARASLGLGSAAVLAAGTAALNALQLDAAAKIPAGVDGSQLINLPRQSVLVAPSWTGGSNSTIVRYAGAGTVTAADKTDTALNLSALFARGSDGELYLRGLVPFAGVTDGQIYFVGTGGALRTTAGIAGDAFNTIAQVGFGLPGNMLWFNPQQPVGAATGSPVALQMESGILVA